MKKKSFSIDIEITFSKNYFIKAKTIKSAKEKALRKFVEEKRPETKEAFLTDNEAIKVNCFEYE